MLDDARPQMRRPRRATSFCSSATAWASPRLPPRAFSMASAAVSRAKRTCCRSNDFRTRLSRRPTRLDYQVGESAGTITAMMSGQKTHSAVLGEGPAVTPEQCDGAAAASIATLLEEAADRGLSDRCGDDYPNHTRHARRNVRAHTEPRLGVRRHDAGRGASARLSRHCAAVGRVLARIRHRRDSRRRPSAGSCRAKSPIRRTPISAACALTGAI